MKKHTVLCLLLCGLLVGCSPQAGDPSVSKDPNASQIQPSTSTSSPADSDLANQQIVTDAMRYRLEYYEQLTQELQQELLALRTELYTSRVEYEAIIASLRGEDVSTDTDALLEKDFSYTVQNEQATLTSYTGGAAELILPATLGGYPVVSVGEGAFRGNTKLVSVTIPDGVTQIDWFAFSGCVFLSNVTLGANVLRIGYGAFENCASTLSFRCPEGSYAQSYARSYGIRTVS